MGGSRERRRKEKEREAKFSRIVSWTFALLGISVGFGGVGYSVTPRHPYVAFGLFLVSGCFFLAAFWPLFSIGKKLRAGIAGLAILCVAAADYHLVLRHPEPEIPLGLTQRTYVSFDPIKSKYDGNPLPVGENFAFNLYFKNVGSISADVHWSVGQLYVLSGPYRDEMRSEALAKFKQWFDEHSQEMNSSQTLAAGATAFTTAFGRKISPCDNEAIQEGKETLFIMAEIGFSDPAGLHRVPLCSWLQPTIPNDWLVWHHCGADYEKAD